MRFIIWLALVCLIVPGLAQAAESLWLEAEQLDGIEGYCWPVAADPARKVTHGKWGLSGPGLAAEWMQGGESGFISIACGADDDAAVATKTLEIPEAGQYTVWVRYRDNREKGSRFQVRLEQAGQQAWTGTYGQQPVVEEDNAQKLYWGWAFAWDGRTANLQKGAVKLSLLSAFKEADCRQIDAIVISSDPNYHPRIKERPHTAARDILDSYAQGVPANLEPLARKHGNFAVPAVWTPKTYKDKGFLYLWNVDDFPKWGLGDPKLMHFPYHLRDAETKAAFEAMYNGRDDVPIFSDPRIVPAFHGASPWALDLDPANPRQKDAVAFRAWLDAHPDRPFAAMMNYAPDDKRSAQGTTDFLTKYRDRFVGNIAGESLGYFYIPQDKLKAITAGAKTRREAIEAISKASMEENAAKYRRIFGQDIPEPYRDVIPCQSNEMAM